MEGVMDWVEVPELLTHPDWVKEIVLQELAELVVEIVTVGVTEMEGEPLGEIEGVEEPLLEGLTVTESVPEAHLDVDAVKELDTVIERVWEIEGVMDWVEVPELLTHPDWVKEIVLQALTELVTERLAVGVPVIVRGPGGEGVMEAEAAAEVARRPDWVKGG